MALKYIALKDNTFNKLQYLGEHSEITERKTVPGQRYPQTVTVGQRYKLINHDGSGQHLVVNIENPNVLPLKKGGFVTVKNLVVIVKSETSPDGNTVLRHAFYAEEIVDTK